MPSGLKSGERDQRDLRYSTHVSGVSHVETPISEPVKAAKKVSEVLGIELD
jgi:hypothetical protein